MYSFMYVDPQKMPFEGHFPSTIFFENYKKMSTPVPVIKHWLVFSYIRSEDYELDQNFGDA